MKDLLKFITCGSVDDGKSTLIGHMLYDAKLLFADQMQALQLESKVGSAGGDIDYSLLLDGLMAEREQGITIDVAYRYFTTSRRSFIVADTPGHEEYTRNMAVGASFADLAVILVDAEKGVSDQTYRHTRICSMMGIRDVVFAINKMDLVDYDEEIYEAIRRDILSFAKAFPLSSMRMIPVSAKRGDNINAPATDTMPWYKQEALLPYLEEIEPAGRSKEEGFMMPVQRVSRPDHTFRGFQGQIASGRLQVGDVVTVLPSREAAHVKALYITDRQADEAIAGQPVTVVLDKEIDVSRGRVLVSAQTHRITDLFRADVLWMDDEDLRVGKGYYLKIGTHLVPAVVQAVHSKVNVNNGELTETQVLKKNEIGSCTIYTSEKIVADTFANSETLGRFVLIDRITNMTSACGTVQEIFRNHAHVISQKLDVTKDLRAQMMGQRPLTLWFTGLPSSGKSTLANEAEKRLASSGRHTMLLDGDNVRLGLGSDLGFSDADRMENIRRVAEVSKLMNDAGLIVLTAFISPFEEDRQRARRIIGADYVEIYVATSLEECMRRDVKGMYKKAREGEIASFTGISSPYEMPVQPDIVIETQGRSLLETTDELMEKLKSFLMER